MENEIYRGEALLPADRRKTSAAVLTILIFCAAVFFAAPCVPFGWVLELTAIIISAFLINAVLKRGIFTVTYVLLKDKMLIFRRYGFIELQTHSVILADSSFSEEYIYTENKKIPFYPDKKLKSLLNL